MNAELHHFFVLTEPGAPQARFLAEFGLVEGAANTHPGQGTANRRFFFTDAALELLYVRDPDEARRGPGERLRIVDRAADRGASPFGVIVRPAPGSTQESFPGWIYHPDYFEAGAYFRIGENSDLLEEPLCIAMPCDLPHTWSPPTSADPFTRVTELRISSPVTRPSRVLEALAEIDRISFQFGESHLMEIVFNGGREGRSVDFRPDLPLLIRW